MSERQRGALSTILAAAGAALLLVGGFALYARQELFDSDAFSRTAAKSLSDSSVRDALARPIVEQIVTVGPDQLINVQPLLEGAVGGALETNAFKGVLQRSARKAHRALFTKDRDELVLTIEDANAVIVSAVNAISPQVGEQIPEDVGRRLVRVTESKPVLEAARVGRDVRLLGLVLPPLGFLCLAGAVLVAPDRRRALVNSLFGVAAAAVIGFIALLVARTLILRSFEDETVRDAVATLYGAYLGGLVDWLVLGGVVAVALAAAAAASEPKPLDRPRRLLAWLVRTPAGRWARAGRALAIGVAGAVAFLEPTLALRIVATLAGAVAIYYAVVELIVAIAPAPEAPKGRGRGAKRQPPPAAGWRAPAMAAATIVAAAVAVAVLVTAKDKREAARPVGPVKACNGYPKLCDRALDDVAFPATHNSMSAAELPGWFTPNQRRGIPRQLEDGVRAFLIDTHYGVKRQSGPVLTDLEREDNSDVLEAARAELGPEGAKKFQQLNARYAKRGGEAEPGTYLCHVVCELGSVELTKALGWFKRFLDTHPDEVVILFIEDKVSPQDTAAPFEQSGILRYAYVHRPGRPFPTMRELIDADRRLFVMAEVDGGGRKFPWYHQGFDLAQETPYTFGSPAELDRAASCAPNRGDPGNPLFQLNHWIEELPRSPAIAEEANSFKRLKSRARDCQRLRGLAPNIIAVDHYDRGDLEAAVRVLNGLPRDGKPSYRKTG